MVTIVIDDFLALAVWTVFIFCLGAMVGAVMYERWN